MSWRQDKFSETLKDLLNLKTHQISVIYCAKESLTPCKKRVDCAERLVNQKLLFLCTYFLSENLTKTYSTIDGAVWSTLYISGSIIIADINDLRM